MNHTSKAIITNDLNKDFSNILSNMEHDKIFILMDNNTEKYCLPLIDKKISSAANKIVIKAGEENKNIETVLYIWDQLDSMQAMRNSLFINLGGGMISDLGGFAASCYKRGIIYINIPTTLLAQVDASAGGKTGFNFNSYKNNIGMFSHPQRVIVDSLFLKTLSKKDILSGYGEMLKHGLINNDNYLNNLLTFNIECIDFKKLALLISTSINIKEDFVRQDPDEKNIRKVLNFGHTIGHAIESYAIKNELNIYHGEAVALGLICELYISVNKMGFPIEKYEYISSVIKRLYPSFDVSNCKDELIEIMLHDKKNINSKINFSLLKDVGKYSIDNYCEREEIIQALEQL